GPEPRQPTPDARGARGVRRRGGTVGTTFPEDDKPCARLAQAAADGGDGLGISGRLADREGSQVAAPAAPPAALDAGRDPALYAERARGMAAGVARGDFHGPPPRGNPGAGLAGPELAGLHQPPDPRHDVVRSPLQGSRRAGRRPDS